MSFFGYVGRGVVEEASGGAPPRSVARQQVLAHGIVVVVHGYPGTKGVLGEGQAGLPVALLKAALVPHVIVFWLVCGGGKQTNRSMDKLLLKTHRSSKIVYNINRVKDAKHSCQIH